MAKYRILSLDGGGLRGLITARLLERLSQQSGCADWLAKTDLFTGTSTGGILALSLANGKPPAEIATLYAQKGPDIFDDSIWDNVRDLGKTIGADFSNRRLKKELRAVFGEITLADLPKKVAVTAFDLDYDDDETGKRYWKPKVFHNFTGDDSDGEFPVVDVALYTSAAPTYFPSVDGYIDGGVFANNPSIVALCQAMDRRHIAAERADLDDIVLLSVGTGVSLTYIRGKSLDWGFTQWAKPLINILMDGVASVSDYQAKQLLGKNRYRRLQIEFNEKERISMDDPDKIKRMEEISQGIKLDQDLDKDLEDIGKWLKTNW